MTCTHVVESALSGQTPQPGAVVHAYFFDPSGEDGQAPREFRVVVAWSPLDPGTQASEEAWRREDICLLETLPGSRFPSSTVAARSDVVAADEGMTYRGWGLRRFETGAEVAEVELRGVIGLPSRHRFSIKAEDTDQATRKGSSGAAVFHELEGLVGMVSMTQGERSGVLIPIEVLREVYPVAPVSTRESQPILERSRAHTFVSDRTWRRAFETFDRKPQAADFSLLFEDLWLAQKTGFLCAIAGLPEDLPEHCRDRFCTEYWRRAYPDANAKARPIPALLPWPPRIGIGAVQRELRRMQNVLRDEVGAEGTAPEQIRTAVDRINKPVILYSAIDQREFGSRAAELLDVWTAYFGEINAEGTEQPLIHMLLLDLDPDLFDPAAEDPERRLASWFGRFASRANKRSQDRPLVHPVELLHRVETDLIENWIEATGAQLGRPPDEIEELRLRARDDLGDIAVLRARDVERWVRDFRPGNDRVVS